MSRKTLHIADIQNELETGSSFFPSRTPVAQKTDSHPVKKKPTNVQRSQASLQRPLDHPPHDADKRRDTKNERMTDVTHDAMPSSLKPRTEDPPTARSNDTMVSRHHATTTPPIEPIRRAVKQIGKEAATHRFTVDEKRAIADIVYTLGQQGYRTSENEIARIAMNSLLLDYKEHGAQSILYRVIKALNA